MYILPGALAPLAKYRQFILVRFVPSVEEPGKNEKFPIHPTQYINWDAHDPSIWMSWQEAAQIAASLGPQYGVGFVITAADPIGCLDLDKCANPDGTWIPEVAQMLAAMPGAMELSNSGKGLHVWFSYQDLAPEHGKKSDALRAPIKWMELYTELRFIALGNSATGVMQDVTALLPSFIAQYFPPVVTGPSLGWTTEAVPEYTHLTDEELFAKALASTHRAPQAASIFDPNGAGGMAIPERATFADMWNAPPERLGQLYPSPTGKVYDGSAFDFAFARELAYWTGKNCERIKTIMLRSSRKRDKWDRPGRKGGYLVETIQGACDSQPNIYKAKTAPVALSAAVTGKLAPTAITHQTFIAREAMAELFKDCVYIQDNNEILLPNGDLVDQPRFKARYSGYMFAMDNESTKPSKDAWDAFINNSVIAFPRADGTMFSPHIPFQHVINESGRVLVNIYKEPEVDRRPGDIAPFLELLHKILPKGDDALILLSYMAAVVQHKGVKFRWAPFVQGTQGNGKSTLTECLMYALGNKYIFSVKAKHIENTFNAWTVQNLLYVADDIYATDNRGTLMEELKTLISDQRQGVTYKGIDSIQKRICGNFIFNSNHKGALKKTDDARRICTLYCAQQSKADRQRDGLTKAYFNRLYKWLNDGGFAYVAEYLHTLEIDARYNPAGECQEAPDTSATQEAIVDSRTGLEHDVAEWIELEEPGFCGGFISSHMLKEKLADSGGKVRTLTYLNMKEMLSRLGYEPHRSLPNGRSPIILQPDRTKPILYVKRDSWLADITDTNAITEIYSSAQSAAQADQISRRFNQ